MFRDLKEYQTIQKIYEEQILKSPHEDLIVEAFQSEEFTAEEIDYVVNNIDQLCNENILSEENNDLNEVLGKVVKNVVQKVAPKLVNTAQKAGKAVASGVDKASPVVKNVASSASKKFGSALGKVKAGLSRAGQAVSNQVDKAKPILKKGLDTAKKVVPAVGALAGAAAVGKKIISGRAAKAETPIKTKPEGANVDTTSEIESSEQSARVETAPERRKLTGKERAQAMAKKRIGSGTAKNPDTTIAQANQRNRDAMRDRARERNTAFQKRREEFRQNKKAGISNSRPQPKVVSPMDTRNDSFIPDGETIEERLGGRGVSKKAAAGSIYPGKKGDGQTEDQDRGAGNKAKKRAGETVEKKSPTFIAYIKNKKDDKKEDKKEDNKMEAYDIVLEYLITSQQAATIEEANYIMTEMDAKTIQDIVSQQLNEQN